MSPLTTDILQSPNGNAPSNLSISSPHINLFSARSSVPQIPSPIATTNSDFLERTTTTRTNDDNKSGTKKREVYQFQSDWLISSIAWSNVPSESFDLAISSYIEDYTNWVQLVSLEKDDFDQEIRRVTSFKHPYPATKILWIPRPADSKQQLPQLLATSADYLRLWRVEEGSSDSSLLFEDRTTIEANNSQSPTSRSHDTTNVKLECLLNTNKGLKHCAPLTSFDWNDVDPSIIVTASVDTTCAVWDIETSKLVDKTTVNTSSSSENSSCVLRSQIIAHNHEVYDVSFSRYGTGRDVFVTAGGDGSVRLFDLRRLSTSSMLYEADKNTPSDRKALVRACCNKQKSNYVSAFAINSQEILMLDTRNTGRPVAVLENHNDDLNSMSWAPHSADHLCSAANDQQALIWELSKLPNSVDQPLLAYRANGKINVISWSSSHSDWIAIAFKNYLELLRV